MTNVDFGQRIEDRGERTRIQPYMLIRRLHSLSWPNGEPFDQCCQNIPVYASHRLEIKNPGMGARNQPKQQTTDIGTSTMNGRLQGGTRLKTTGCLRGRSFMVGDLPTTLEAMNS